MSSTTANERAPFSKVNAVIDIYGVVDGTNVPIVGPILMLCGNIIHIIITKGEVEEESDKILRQCCDFESILSKLQNQIRSQPDLEVYIEVPLSKCKDNLEEILRFVKDFNKMHRVQKCIFSGRMQDLLKGASESLASAERMLHLGISAAALNKISDIQLKQNDFEDIMKKLSELMKAQISGDIGTEEKKAEQLLLREMTIKFDDIDSDSLETEKLNMIKELKNRIEELTEKCKIESAQHILEIATLNGSGPVDDFQLANVDKLLPEFMSLLENSASFKFTYRTIHSLGPFSNDLEIVRVQVLEAALLYKSYFINACHQSSKRALELIRKFCIHDSDSFFNSSNQICTDLANCKVEWKEVYLWHNSLYEKISEIPLYGPNAIIERNSRKEESQEHFALQTCVVSFAGMLEAAAIHCNIVQNIMCNLFDQVQHLSKCEAYKYDVFCRAECPINNLTRLCQQFISIAPALQKVLEFMDDYDFDANEAVQKWLKAV